MYVDFIFWILGSGSAYKAIGNYSNLKVINLMVFFIVCSLIF